MKPQHQRRHLLKRGCIHIYAGEGKGKTTASLGLALRMLGAGGRVFLGQFLKNPKKPDCALVHKIRNLTCQQFGRPGWVRQPISAADVNRSQAGWQVVREAIESGKFDLVIADEILLAVKWGMLEEKAVLDCLRARPQWVEVVLTGREATPALLRAADLVTVMKAAKHYYQQGLAARRGIEF